MGETTTTTTRNIPGKKGKEIGNRLMAVVMNVSLGSSEPKKKKRPPAPS